MSDPRTLMTGIVFGESPRWHDGRLWFADWARQEIIAVDLDGNSEMMLRPPCRHNRATSTNGGVSRCTRRYTATWST